MRGVAWPAFAKIVNKVFHVRPHSRGFGSVTGFGQFEAGTGARWVGAYTVAAMCAATALKFRAFLHSLRGVSGTFRITFRDEEVQTRKAIYTDGTRFTDGTTFTDDVTPVETISGALSAGATTVEINGSGNVSISVGDFARIGDQLIRVVAKDGNTLTVAPAIRDDHADGAAIEFASVYGDFRITNSPAVSIVPGARSQPVDIEFEEHF